MWKILLVLGFLVINVHPTYATSQQDYVKVKFQPEAGDKVHYRLDRFDTHYQDGQVESGPVEVAAEFSIEYLGKQSDGNVYNISFQKYGLKDSSLNIRPVDKAWFSMLDGMSLEYLAGEDGTPIAVRDIKIFREMLDLVLNHTTDGGKVQEYFMGLNAAAAIHMIFGDLSVIFSLTGGELSTIEANEFENIVPWEATGTEFVSKGVTNVLSFDDETVSTLSEEKISRESVQAAALALLEKIVEETEENQAKLEEVESYMKGLESFRLNRTLYSTVSIANGWPSKIKQIRAIEFGPMRHVRVNNLVQIVPISNY